MLERPAKADVGPVEGRGLVISRGRRRLLDGVNVSFAASRVTAIIGPNGAGKTLLIRLLCGLAQPDAGEVLWAGTGPDSARRRGVGLLLQAPVMLRRTALANVELALSGAGKDRAAVRELAIEALEIAGLSHLANVPARQLSGGEKQRLALARAMAMKPALLFLDEPTASLDPAATLAIEEMTGRAAAGGTGIVLVTHDLGQARRLAERVVFMHRGRVVEEAEAQAFFDAPQTDEARRFCAGEIVI